MGLEDEKEFAPSDGEEESSAQFEGQRRYIKRGAITREREGWIFIFFEVLVFFDSPSEWFKEIGEGEQALRTT